MLALFADRTTAKREGLSSEDRAACRALLETGSHTFFAASQLLPRRVRDPATALYAFCRLADDAVDEGPGDGDALAALSDRLDAVYRGGPLVEPADRAFAWVVKHYRIPHALPNALIEGFSWDAAGRRYDGIDDLYAYAVRVAGTVGLMMSLLMEVRERHALARACDLGVAMQLTNIARDVGEDARFGRLYLPQEWLREVGIEPQEFLAEPRFTSALGGVVQRLLDHADVLYRRSMAGVHVLPWRARTGICAARLLYAEIGREVERRGLDSVNQRAVVARGRKVRVLLGVTSALARSQTGLSAPVLAQAHHLIESIEVAADP